MQNNKYLASKILSQQLTERENAICQLLANQPESPVVLSTHLHYAQFPSALNDAMSKWIKDVSDSLKALCKLLYAEDKFLSNNIIIDTFVKHTWKPSSVEGMSLIEKLKDSNDPFLQLLRESSREFLQEKFKAHNQRNNKGKP